MAIIRYVFGSAEATRYLPLAKKWALRLLRAGGRDADYPLPDGGFVRVERVGPDTAKCFVDAGAGPFYQFLCPTPIPRYDRISIGGTPIDMLTGSAVAVDLRQLPKDAGIPVPASAIFATGTTVEEAPPGATRFQAGTHPYYLFLQRVTWQADGFGANAFAPSNRRTGAKEERDFSRALLTPWFAYSAFVGNLDKLDYQYGPGIGDWGYDIPPAAIKGRDLGRRIMEPDADWPDNSALYVAGGGERFCLMLAADFTLHAWRLSARRSPHANPYANQNQNVTLDAADVRSFVLPVPEWADVADVPFRDQVDPANLGDLPRQPRPQGHFRHDGRRMAAILYRRQETAAHWSMRENDPAPADHDHHLAFEDHGPAKVAPNPGYSVAPYPTVSQDATGWAEWTIEILVGENGDFSLTAALESAVGPDDAGLTTRMPVAIGYAAPRDWTTSGAPTVVSGELLVSYLHLYADAAWDQIVAWHTGGLIGSLQLPAAAVLAIEKATGAAVATLSLSRHRDFAGLADSPQLLAAARAGGDAGVRGHVATLYALDLSTLSFLALVNQYGLTASAAALTHHAPHGYPLTATHDVRALGVVYGAVVVADELAAFLPDAPDAAELLFGAPDLDGLTALPATRVDRAELAFFHVDDSGLAHWTKHLRVTEEAPVENGSYPHRMLYRLYPSDYDLSAPPTKTLNRTFAEALALALDDYEGEIAADAVADFADWRDAIEAIVAGPMADYLAARFPWQDYGNPFGLGGGVDQIDAALDYVAGVNQTHVHVYNKIAGALVEAGLHHDDYRFRPLALTAYDCNRHAYNAAFQDHLKYAPYLRIGMDGWIAISSAFLVPTRAYRTHKAYWRAPDDGSSEPALSPTGELRRYSGKFSDGWTDIAAFAADTWQLKQVDHFFNLNGTARYSHREFYNAAYQHAHEASAFCQTTTEVHESAEPGLTDGVWFKTTTPVERADSSEDTLADYVEPFETFLQGAFVTNNKAVGMGKHFFIGSRSWKP